MKKKHKLSPARYQRYDCILAIEGEVDPAYLHRLLTGGNAHLDERQRLDAVRQGRAYKPVGGPYKNILKKQLAGNLALNVFNRKTHLSQRLLCVYRASGTITDAEVKRLERSGECIVDFIGHIDILRDDNGKPVVRHIHGRIKKEVCEGEVIFVGDADSTEPPETAFLIDSLDDGATRIVRPPLFAKIDPELAGFERVATIETSATGSNEPLTIAIDAAGELMDSFNPDGSAGFDVGPHDHVVLLLTQQRRVIKGTKADMVGEGGVLASLKKALPEQSDVFERVHRDLAACDPSDVVAIVTFLADGTYSVETIPQSAFRQE